ncbi:MAG: protein-L-isoaspartate(D-aspartate) O-methyltransferase [Anaerolineae bacterium]|nr:protein-L-isoaspartate(D-aspartate) O-methyltransferase [Anaerolineae bacterium]
MLLATLLICLIASGCSGAETGAISTPVAPDEPSATRVLNRQLQDSEDTREQRQRLVDNYIAPVVSDARVVAASQAVPRHCFIPTESLDYAYYDHALPIGYGQTISQPSLVATMTELLELEDGDRVLEIGTGSGYQAAILRELTDEVYSIEIIPQLLDIAREVLDALDYGDIHLLRADGYNGWPEYAPYDAIIVTAAPDHLPTPLVEQLSPEGGRMVIPIGPVGNVQTLWLVIRQQDEVQMERIMSVVFVPFTREQDS